MSQPLLQLNLKTVQRWMKWSFVLPCRVSSNLFSKKHAAGRVISGTAVTCFVFGCAETWACGKKNTRAVLLGGTCLYFHPVKAAMITAPELVTPSEMLTCIRISDSETPAKLPQDMRKLRYLKGPPVLFKIGFSCGLSLAEFIQYIRVRGHNAQRGQSYTRSKNLKVKQTYLPQKSL